MRDLGPFGSTIDPDSESSGHWATSVPEGEASGESAAGDAAQQFGRFRLLRLLGQGGMGVVHAAYDGQLDRVVALKMVRGDRNTAVIGRFIREAKALAKLSHPNVVQIFDVSTLRGAVFLAMEYVRGRTLREEMSARRREGGFEAIVDLFLQAGRGLAAVHAAGLVHRDFKPDNVMVGDDGRVRVMDFGLARASDAPATGRPMPADGEASGTEARLTAVGSVVGTPAYMSPEQHRGAAVDVRTDVFSFCAALYEGLYGVPPFLPGDYHELRTRPGEAGAPAWLREVVLRGLRVEPGERWPAFEPLLAALAADPVAARRRSRLRFAFAAAIAALAVAATGGALELRRRWQHARVEAAAAEHLAAVEAHGADQAEAAFEVFVADPAHQGTRALAQAWRGQGDRRHAAGDRKGALTAYGRAYAEAREPEDAQAAMRAITGLYLAAGEAAGLENALAALRLDPSDPAQVDLAVDAHLLRRDLAQAKALLDAAPAAGLVGARPLLAALARGRALSVAAHWLALLPEGPDAVAAIAPSEHELVVLDRALAPVRRWHSDRPIRIVPGAPWAITSSDGTGRLFDLRAPEQTLATVPTPTEVFPTIVVDGDGDGADEFYFLHASPERGFKVMAGPGSPVRVAHPASEATGSDLMGLAAADLDGDGTREVAAALGGYTAYDLRIFRAGPTGELELLARRTVGNVQAMAPVRRPDGGVALAVAIGGIDNDEVFPEPPHVAGPPGLYLFDWTGEAVVEVGRAPPPSVGSYYGKLILTPDLDGDGRQEIVAPFQLEGHMHSQVVRQLDDGRLEAFEVGHTLALAAGQLDADPADELFVADSGDGAVWVLGLGDDPRPPVPGPVHEPVTAPPELHDASLRARLARADELDAIGLPGSAAEVVQETAVLVADAPVKRRLLDRAARLFVSAGEADRALELGALVEEDPQLAGPALMRRVELLTELGRFAEAAEAAERLQAVAVDEAQAASATAALTRLRPLLDEANAIELRFDRPLDPAWQIDRPATMRRDAATGRLQVELIADQLELASLPITWDGGPLQIEVELDARHAEHNTALLLGLFDEAGRSWLALGLRAGGHNRKHTRHHVSYCQPVSQLFGPNIVERPAVTAATQQRMVLRAVYFPDRATTECVAVDGELRGRERYPVGEAPLPGAYTLRLGSLLDRFAPHLVAADIRSISVRGARIDRRRVSTDPRHAAARALVDGEPRAVLSALVAVPPDAPGRALLELLAYDDLGDRPGVEASAGRALVGLPLADRIHLLRARPGLAAWVREAAGDGLPELLADTWDLLARMHLDDPEVQRRVLAGLRGIEGLVPADDRQRLALGELLATRGRVHQQLGDVDRAWRDREAALAVLASCADAGADEERASIHEVLAATLAGADPARALHHAAQALALETSPELLRERLARHRAVAELVARDPAWRLLLDSRR
ncbi:serine/threonine-protein kinase [Nannocystis sp. SCPEA4]|uniref:serine/threonine-protein kinase n=1 Tax=Nannocystis sp. SCPEA4 TaxID=2996787 RepID=UPI00226F44AE|nr:serine/threonine-protein kinase [Nannocystis sp. SCPEA4]